MPLNDFIFWHVLQKLSPFWNEDRFDTWVQGEVRENFRLDL